MLVRRLVRIGFAASCAVWLGSGCTLDFSEFTAESTGTGPATATCGNGMLEEGEACEPGVGDGCPTSCDESADPCRPLTLSKPSDECSAVCEAIEITAARDGDGCCPEGLSNADDSDCSASCGNGVLDLGETCEPDSEEAACPTKESCEPDEDLCTVETFSGTNCTAQCIRTQITEPVSGDGCCPPAGNANIDDDCEPVCGNGVPEDPETCDTRYRDGCPETKEDCPDDTGCVTYEVVGDPASCSSSCEVTRNTTPSGDVMDGCCPPGATLSIDSDCTPVCGNGVVDVGETCDSPASCAALPACESNDACTRAVVTGGEDSCDLACDYQDVTECSSEEDGCCPAGCDGSSDVDCPPVELCGNGVIDLENNEHCDGDSCPTAEDCATMVGSCERGRLVGDASKCTARCAIDPITTCDLENGADGCCPEGCNSKTDLDCEPVCGNDVIEDGELCDPSCPENCDNGNPCTEYDLKGTGCNLECVLVEEKGAEDGDGCCPAGLGNAEDSDCAGAVCGNGYRELTEKCDDGCDASNSSCEAPCPTSVSDCPPRAGDGAEATEVAGSAENCSAYCVYPDTEPTPAAIQ